MTPADQPCPSCTTPREVCKTSVDKAVAALAVSVRKDPLLVTVVVRRNRCCKNCGHS